ncbi:MAG: hypothetical protein V1800_03775 [Candidatus Latescibacterota bacterium]
MSPNAKFRMKEDAARVLAHLLNPVLTTFFAIFLLSLSAASWQICAPWVVTGGVFVVLLPCSYFWWLRREGIISEFYIPERAERTGPFLSLIVFYSLGIFVLRWLDASSSVRAALVVHIVNVALIAGVTRLCKWSFHVLSAATTAGILFHFFGPPGLISLAFVAALFWSRVHTRAHSVSQVLGGGLLGFFSALLQLELFF